MSNQQFFESVDFQPLRVQINRVLGFEVDLGEISLSEGRYIKFNSQCIADKGGIFTHAFSEVRVQPFGTSIDGEEKTIWISIDFRVTYKVGGTNGFNFMSAHYSAENGWSFSNEISATLSLAEKNTIRTFISKGETKNALQYAIEICDNNIGDFKLLLKTFEEKERQYLLTIIEYSEFSTTIAKINDAILTQIK